MKKHSDYRLIKEYPGSYKIGYILKALNGYEAGKYWVNNNWFNPEEFPEYWEKVKEPLFITEDGIGKSDGDMCFFVTPIQYSLGFGCVVLGAEFKSALARFHDQNKAKIWIEENKPQFSKKDMMNFHNCSEVCFDLWYSKYKK